MKRVVVRYKVKPERLAEHEALVRDVFAELEKVRPAGLAYQALVLEDGLSFVHIASISTADGTNPLAKLPSFQAFTRTIAERIEEKPVSTEATALGAYRATDAPA